MLFYPTPLEKTLLHLALLIHLPMKSYRRINTLGINAAWSHKMSQVHFKDRKKKKNEPAFCSSHVPYLPWPADSPVLFLLPCSSRQLCEEVASVLIIFLSVGGCSWSQLILWLATTSSPASTHRPNVPSSSTPEASSYLLMHFYYWASKTSRSNLCLTHTEQGGVNFCWWSCSSEVGPDAAVLLGTLSATAAELPWPLSPACGTASPLHLVATFRIHKFLPVLKIRSFYLSTYPLKVSFL